MTVTTAQRLALYDKMKQTLGADHADILFDILPPMDPTDIATHRDIEHATIVLRGEMTELRSELRGEMTELRSELRGEMTELRGELRGEMAELRGELLGAFGELQGAFKASTRHTLITIISAAVTIWLTFYLPAVL